MLKIATKFAPSLASLDLAWRAGFRFAEFYLNPEILAGVPEIVATAREFPLEYVPHFPNKKVNKETVQQCVELYQQLGCRAMVIHQPMINRWGKAITKLDESIQLAVENHYLNEKQFWEWAETNPGLNLDIEHLWKFTLKDAKLAKLESFLDKFLKKHIGKLKHVHLPGYVPGYSEHRPMYCSRELMHVAWGLLAKHNYDYFMVSEINGEFQNLEEMQMDLLLFQRWQTEQTSAK